MAGAADWSLCGSSSRTCPHWPLELAPGSQRSRHIEGPLMTGVPGWGGPATPNSSPAIVHLSVTAYPLPVLTSTLLLLTFSRQSLKRSEDTGSRECPGIYTWVVCLCKQRQKNDSQAGLGHFVLFFKFNLKFFVVLRNNLWASLMLGEAVTLSYTATSCWAFSPVFAALAAE